MNMNLFHNSPQVWMHQPPGSSSTTGGGYGSNGSSMGAPIFSEQRSHTPNHMMYSNSGQYSHSGAMPTSRPGADAQQATAGIGALNLNNPKVCTMYILNIIISRPTV